MPLVVRRPGVTDGRAGQAHDGFHYHLDLTATLADLRLDLLGEGLRRLDTWIARRLGDSLRGDPFWAIVRDGGPLHANQHRPDWQGYLERPRATGRGHHAELRQRFGGRPFTTGLEG